MCLPKVLKMRYIAAACLTALAGKEVNADNIVKILRYIRVFYKLVDLLYTLFAFRIRY